MRFIDFFAGIGGFRLGMEQAGHKCVGFCELDKFAVKSYRAMHNTEGEWYASDITKVRADELPAADCWCFGFPCQDISVAGKMRGFRGKRSSLFFAVTGLIRDLEEENRPTFLFIENVKNLLSINRGFDFAKLLIELGEIGYDAEWQVLNSKYHGVPQNRERVYVVGHLRGRGRPQVFPIRASGEKANGGGVVANTLTTRYAASGREGTYIEQTRQPSGEIERVITGAKNHQHERVYSPDGISPCLTAKSGGGHEPKAIVLETSFIRRSGIYTKVSEKFQRGVLEGVSRALKASSHDAGVVIREATKKGYTIAEPGDSINTKFPNSKTRRGRVGKGIAQTLETQCGQGVYDGTLIRRFTPLECFRLQGFPDEYFYKAQAVNSDSQLYKQAGNSVTVNVIKAIAERLEGEKNVD